MIYIGSEHVLSPIGETAQQNFEAVQNGVSGIKVQKADLEKSPSSTLENVDIKEGYSKIESLGINSALACVSGINESTYAEKWLFILSTTKGDIDHLQAGDVDKAKPSYLANRIAENLPFNAEVLVVSNACISGLLAAITAHDLIATKKYDHALVVGVDVVSEFTTRGFESFYALSKTPSSPFDENRTGLSLGEAVASVVLSSNEKAFKNEAMVFAGGSSANDANHISGPSRTGEGLTRSIQSAMKYSHTTSQEIDFISAHGTGTRYNDDMESIAFNRCELSKTPVNSFKGYFGHTLGAAGTIELAMSIQSMRNSVLIKTLGCETPGTTNTVNVLLENKLTPVNTVLKTASGFGGCNAAAILKKS